MNDKSQFGEIRAGDNLKTGGAKYDAGKPEVFQGVFDYFPRALLEVANVSGYGAAKYSWGGQKSVPDAYVRYGNSLGRHQMLAGIDGPYDIGPGGSGLLHDAQVAWNALAKLEVGLRDGHYLSTRGNPIPAKVVETVGVEATKDFAAFEAMAKADPRNAGQLNGLVTEKEAPTEAEAEAAIVGLLQRMFGADAFITNDPREFYAASGKWPEGLEKTQADRDWIAHYEWFGGSQFEVTEAGKKALKPNRIKRGAAPAAKKRAPAKARGRAPARKR